MTAFLWALLTAGIWGVVPLMEKIGLAGGSPTVAVVVRSFGVLAGLLVFGWWLAPWPALQGLSWRSVALLMGGGFLASFVGQLAFYHALRTGAISQVTPVAGAYPLVAALLGWWVLREPLTLPRLLGVVFVVAGVLLLRK
ncbi:MAG: EamA family transporter [Candidatus Omnitrophica bacterium]|nr:EamA family transporter [Candidatus Omnitrophota bacterium]